MTMNNKERGPIKIKVFNLEDTEELLTLKENLSQVENLESGEWTENEEKMLDELLAIIDSTKKKIIALGNKLKTAKQ